MANSNYLKNQRELDQFQRYNLLFNYNALESIRPPNLPSKIYIWDETLCDGEQIPGVSLALNEKIDIAKLNSKRLIIADLYDPSRRYDKNLFAFFTKSQLDPQLNGFSARLFLRLSDSFSYLSKRRKAKDFSVFR